MKSLKIRAALFILSLGIIFSYQNCGQDIQLTKPAESPNPPAPQNVSQGHFCSQVGPSVTTPLKLLFVTDMSASNYGGALGYNTGPGSNPFRWTTGKAYKEAAAQGLTRIPSPVVFDMGIPAGGVANIQTFANSLVVSDGNGNRFAAIQNFLSASSACSAINDNFSYSVMGFSTNVMMPRNSTETCESPYVSDPTAFSNLVTGLKQFQDEDTAAPLSRVGGSASPYQMFDTNYMKGLNCMSQKIQRDALISNEDLPFYYVVFMSDGMPSDKQDPCPYNSYGSICSFQNHFDGYPNAQACIDGHFNQCQVDWGLAGRNCYERVNAGASSYWTPACYRVNGLGAYTYMPNCTLPDGFQCINQTLIPKTVERLKQQVGPIASGFKFQPVFYWPSGQPGSQRDQAHQVMEPLAQIGGVNGVIDLSDAASMQTLQQQVCSTIQTSMHVNFQIKNYMAVNLTARMLRGELKADSDMDGITDDDRTAAGHSPVNPRDNSLHVLNSLCQSRPDLCSQALTCNPNTFYSLGLNECDVLFLRKMTTNPVNGVDSNNNSVLDFIEILKGANPLQMGETTTSGADNLPLIYAIGKGYDVTSDNSVYVPATWDLMNADFNYVQSSSECNPGEETMGFSLNHLPLVHTQAFTADPRTGPFSLNHAADENIIAVTYSVSPVGAVQGQEKTYVYLMKVPFGHVPSTTIHPADFSILQGAP